MLLALLHHRVILMLNKNPLYKINYTLLMLPD